jgi:HK97 family phage portal protein
MIGSSLLQWLGIGRKLTAASPENPSTDLSNPAEWLSDWASGGHPGTYGPHVSERTAMAVSAVYRCVALRSGIIASLPLKVYRRTKDGRDAAPQHRLQPMFQVAAYPGRAMTAFIWRELWGVNTDLWGNHYSIIRYDGAARIVGFEPVMPWDVEVFRFNWRSVYRCLIWEGPGQRVEWVDQDDMIHIPGPGFNGIVGVSRIRANARNAVSMALLLEEQTGLVHENAARPSGMATVPKGISDEGFKRFKSQFMDNNTGRHNAGKVLFAEDGSTFSPFQMSPEDLHTIDLRRFTVADISRFYGVPLHLLNETEKSTSWGTGLSEQTLAFLIYTLNPDLERIEGEVNYKLFWGSEYYVEFDRDALLAMDPVKAAEIASAEISSGVMTINERRRHKNRPPVEHGDETLINATNVPLSKIFEPLAQPRQDPIQADPLAPRGAPGTAGAETGAAADAQATPAEKKAAEQQA